MKLKIHDYFFIFITLTSITLYFSLYPLNVDSTWILYAAKQMINGAILYVDVTDVNPPLIFLYSIIPAFISKITNIDNTIIFIIFTLLLISISISLIFNIIRKIETLQNQKRIILYTILFAQTILIGNNFGEREHFFIIFTLPYLIYMIYNQNVILSSNLRVYISIFASLGFNLKPHFFLIFVAIELFYIFNKKDLKAFFRIEPIIISSSAIIYLICIYIFFNEYLTISIPISLDTYANVFKKSFSSLILNYETILLCFSIIMYFILKPKENRFSIKMIFISLFCSLFIYLIQAKGWSYHKIPFLVSIVLLIIHSFIFSDKKNLIYSFTFIPFLISIISFNITDRYPYTQLKQIISSLPEYATIQIVSPDIAGGQPLLKKNQIWASRYPSLFMISTFNRKKDFKTKEFLLDSFIKDLNKFTPKYIIFPNKKKGTDFYKFMIDLDIRLKKYYESHYNMTEQLSHRILIRK